jgi:transcriptional regulator with XRE-family HTH domain
MENDLAFYAQVGRRVRALRGKRALTQEALASLVDLTRTSITNIEKGRQKLLLHTLIDLAEALQVEPTDLLPSTPATLPKKQLDQWLKGHPRKHREWVKSIIGSNAKEK